MSSYSETDRESDEVHHHKSEAEPKPRRIIDIQIPLPYLLSCLGLLGLLLVSMYYSVAQLVRDVGELQITVKAGNMQTTKVDNEVAILKWRLDAMESTARARSEMPQQAQPNGRR